ncbi:hypothetical protein ACFL2T_07300, partial [Elusimicrobiota bacterium]
FIYQANTPTDSPQLGGKLVVLPFEDGTEDFVVRGGKMHGTANITKGGMSALGVTVSFIPPELWARSFADELKGSGAFQSVDYLSDPSEITDQGIVVRAKILASYYQLRVSNYANTKFEVSFWADSQPQGERIWERTVRVNGEKTPMVAHKEIMMYIRRLLGQARGDLVRALMAGGVPDSGKTGPKNESVEDILKAIGED